MVAVAAMSARERLRSFEDRVLPDAPRPYGEIETGIGSRFSGLPVGDHQALCSLVVADHLCTMAAAEHVRLEGVYNAALAKVDATASKTSITQTEIVEEA